MGRAETGRIGAGAESILQPTQKRAAGASELFESQFTLPFGLFALVLALQDGVQIAH